MHRLIQIAVATSAILSLAAPASPAAIDPRDPTLIRYHSIGRQTDPAAPIPALVGKGSPLTYEIARGKDGKPLEPARLVPGPSPGTSALRIDSGSLAAESFAPSESGFTAIAHVRIDGPGQRRGNAGATNGTILAAGSGYWDGWRLTFSYPDRKLTFSIGRPRPSQALSITSDPIPDRAWQQIAVSWDRKVMRLYLDGFLLASGPFAEPFAPPQNPRAFRVGFNDAGIGSVALDIAELAIFARALAPAEILRAALGADAPPADALAPIAGARIALLDGRASEAERSLQALLDRRVLPPDLAALARIQLVEAQLRQNAISRVGAGLETLLSSQAATPDRATRIDALLVALIRAGSPSSLPAALLRRALDLPDLSPDERPSTQLALAHATLADRDPGTARAHYAELLSRPDLPPILRDIARGHLERSVASPASTRAAQPERTTRVPPPRWPDPAVVLHVAPDGDDAASGTAERPFATLERARDELRTIRAARGALPAGGASIVIAGGEYRVARTLKLGREDSGAVDAPVVYRARDGQVPVFTAGTRVRGFEPVRDPAILDRLPQAARGKVWKADLAACGAPPILPVRVGGYSSGAGFKSHPATEIFFDGRAMRPARWPNDGFAHVREAVGPTPLAVRGRSGTVEGHIRYEGDRPSRWIAERDAILHGYWWHDWADSSSRIARIDPARSLIELTPPHDRYGYRAGQRFRALNLLCEIDLPGESTIDRQSGILYLYPPSDPTRARIELTTAPWPFLELENVAHVGFQGIAWQLGSADGIVVRGGERVTFAGCAVRHFAGNGVELRGGTGHALISCDIHSMGRGAVVLDGGDRKTLAPGGHLVVNCHLHDLSRIDPTYTPAVLLNGVGHRVAHCLAHDIASSAFRVGGNDHVVERNEVFRVVTESDDQGGIDIFGDPTFRGNIFRENFWHHIGEPDAEDPPACGRAGIRLDDAISGTLIAGNIFYRCSSGKAGFGGIQIHGGKDNLVDGNLFVECTAAISFSPWGEGRWLEHIPKHLDSPQIDRALYARRYPDLDRIRQRPDVNVVTRNVAVRCGAFLLRDRAGNLRADNLVTDADPGFADAARGDFRIAPPSPALARAGIELRIPHDQIGLYRDPLRRTLPEDLVRAARAGPSRTQPDPER